jgi:hypothetical protein
VQDDLFAKVAELVPGIREEESDDDVDIAAIMARQRQQAERIRQEAASMRSSGVCHPVMPSLSSSIADHDLDGML